ncbi:sensor histidine kinase [Geodermatophilus sp. CPCC 205761]|uniref:sensor histidine kinase n=1 Tax=Geodermatophilus sp. CPCC 205761 TaxID=2936597 RepID=UPI003EEB570B
MRTATSEGTLADALRGTWARLSTGRLAAVVALIAVLALANDRARHTVLVVLGVLGLFAAGAGFLVRWRVTGTGASWQTGMGLVLLGLQLPAVIAVNALLDQRWPAAATAAGLCVVAWAAVVSLRAFTDPVTRPRLQRAVVISLTALLVAGTTLALVAVVGPWPALAWATVPAAYLLAGAPWLAVTVAAWRIDPLGARDRRSARTLAVIGLAVGVLTALSGLPSVLPATTTEVQTVFDLGLLLVALVALDNAARGLADALAGQERYVAGLLEQLAGHERQLQQVRGCLHDARAAVAGIRAGSSAVRHLALPADAAARADLEESVAVELARLERMLRLPDRPPSVSSVDLDGLVRALVIGHRERGLRVSWAPSEQAPVVVDGDALAVILGNLLGNALVHAPGALCRVSVDVGDHLTVTVADNGPGLPAARRAAAFEAGARRSGSPGEGLGLAISRDLARRHGGDLVAEDATVGTRFVLRLPLHSPAPTAAVVELSQSGSTAGMRNPGVPLKLAG